MSIADELFEEMKAEQFDYFLHVGRPKLGDVGINPHGTVRMSVDTAMLICDSEETRDWFRNFVSKWIKAMEKAEKGEKEQNDED